MIDTTWHDTQVLNGIGPVMAEALSGVGIHHSEQLLGHPDIVLAQSLADLGGLTVENLMAEFIPQARLLRLDGLSEAQALDLAQRGHDYGTLMLSDAEDLMSTLDGAGHPAEMQDLLKAQLGAAQRYQKGTLLVRVVDPDLQPVADAEVFIIDPPGSGTAVAWTYRTNQRGYALIEMVAAGQSAILAFADDRAAYLPMALTAQARSLMLVLDRDAPDGITHDEAVDGPVAMAVPASRPQVDLADLADGTLLEYSGMHENHGVLTVFFRKRFKLTWRIEITSVPQDDLPAEINPGALLLWTGSALTDTGLTSLEARLTLMQGNPLPI